MLDQVNIHSDVAVYVQIENEVMFGIAAGKLKAGDQLPSVRELSERLEVNPNTVAKSYRDLEVMGLLYTRRGMGVFINKGIQARCKKDCQERMTKRMYEVIQEAKSAGIPKNSLNELMTACWKVDGSPYGEAPKRISGAVT